MIDPAPVVRSDSQPDRRERDIELALQALSALLDEEFTLGITEGSVAGLDTPVVVLETFAGAVPLFAYINDEVRAVLRARPDRLALPVDGRSGRRDA